MKFEELLEQCSFGEIIQKRGNLESWIKIQGDIMKKKLEIFMKEYQIKQLISTPGFEQGVEQTTLYLNSDKAQLALDEFYLKEAETWIMTCDEKARKEREERERKSKPRPL